VGKYLNPRTSPEKDPISGSDKIMAEITNIGWKQVHDWCKIRYDYDKADARNNPTPQKNKEMKISDQIWEDIREIYKRLNPSTSGNYGASAPPDSEHLGKTKP